MGNTTATVAGVLLTAGLALPACSGGSSARLDREAADVQRLLTSPPASVGRDRDRVALWKTMRTAYRARQNRPMWTDDGSPTRGLDELLVALREADSHGLDPERYGLDRLQTVRARAHKRFRPDVVEDDAIARLDVDATWAWTRYAADLSAGAADVEGPADKLWRLRRQKIDFAKRLAESLDRQSIGEDLRAFAPQHPEYGRLREAYARYKQNAMNEAAGKQVRQIELNLERWRWLPRDLGDRYILVNVPDFELEVHDAGQIPLSMKVVVGAKSTPTPVFSDTMTHVVFSPYWNVPDGIAEGETLPAVQADPAFLERNGIEVVDTSGQKVDVEEIDWTSFSAEEGTLPYRFRQRPGSTNSLGLVKFIFPNEYDVYLHDTPADALFKRKFRALSHGCVRVEQPQALAEYLLKDQPEWTSDRIKEAMHAGEEKHVKLTRPIAVHLTYWTVRADEDGTVQFRDDVYNRDARALAQLASAVRTSRPRAGG
ncbi:MAG TPA: L,D-transpeptidase family protein [Vicinamibacterales bacterium]|jgi:murein L,D-transpeptidase YcbB/YkuD|nr:L,D-transpeptidase family protein [Vicinamibacterales bacterium]